MAIEIVDFPMKYGGSFHSYVDLPEGKRDMPGFSVFKCANLNVSNFGLSVFS